MSSPHARLRDFATDRRGSVAVVGAISLSVMIAICALGVDLGKVFVDRRKAQSATDLAAIAAAADLANAQLAASATVSRNNITGAAKPAIQLGLYTGDTRVAMANRFQNASAANANAVRVTLNSTAPVFFARAFLGKDKLDVRTVATATVSSFATFAIGSRLAKLDGGIMNKVLGSLIGANLSLSAMDYRALLDTQIDLFDLANATATRAGITAGTYDKLLQSNVKTGDLVGALADVSRAKNGNSSATLALSSVLQSLSRASDKISLGSLADLGPYASMATGQKPQLSVSASALDLLNATAQAANGNHQAEAALDVSVPGIAAASLKVAIGERPVGTSWITTGRTGASVHTAQTRLLLTVQLTGTAPIAAVNLPIYLELASATATLGAVTCGFPNINTSRATISVTPSVADAWIGNVSASEFTNMTSAPRPGPAVLASILGSGITVTGRAHATVTNLSPDSVSFSYSDVQNRTRKTVGTRNFTASLLSNLFSDLDLKVSVLGLDLIVNPPDKLVASIITNAATPIDTLLNSVLVALGVGLGQADVWMTGLRCDGAVLVN